MRKALKRRITQCANEIKKAERDALKREKRRLKMLAKFILKKLNNEKIKTKDGSFNSFLSLMDVETLLKIMQLMFDIDGVVKPAVSKKLLFQGKELPSVIFTLARAQMALSFMSGGLTREMSFKKVVDELSEHDILVSSYPDVIQSMIAYDNNYYINVGYTLGGGYADGVFNSDFVKFYFMFSLLEKEEQFVSDKTANQAIFLMKLLSFLKKKWDTIDGLVKWNDCKICRNA